MILVDTSVWIDHLRRGDKLLATLLEDGLVFCHPFVIGELACGNLKNRGEILSLLASLPQAELATHEEAISLVAEQELHGKGIGWIDAHLLAATILSGAELWTRDGALQRIASTLGIDHTSAI